MIMCWMNSKIMSFLTRLLVKIPVNLKSASYSLTRVFYCKHTFSSPQLPSPCISTLTVAGQNSFFFCKKINCKTRTDLYILETKWLHIVTVQAMLHRVNQGRITNFTQFIKNLAVDPIHDAHLLKFKIRSCLTRKLPRKGSLMRAMSPSFRRWNKNSTKVKRRKRMTKKTPCTICECCSEFFSVFLLFLVQKHALPATVEAIFNNYLR